MSIFTADPIYELDLINKLCYFDGIGLTEYDNTINDTGYTYSGLTLLLDFTGFTSHFDTTGHTYSNVILNNDVYIYTGLTGETHYFEIFDFYSGATPTIDTLLFPLTESEVISGFLTTIISCTEKLDGLTGTCCPSQQILSNIPLVLITNEGGGTDNCDDYIARRTPEGWTLDFVFNKNGSTGWTESVFWFTGVRDEYEIENYADNGLSFRFTDEGKIAWYAYRYSGYCDTVSGYTAMYYVDSGETTNALCSGGTSNDFNITITFERNNVYENCDIENEGGWNDLVLWTGTTEELNSKWNNSRNLRLGTLKIYHNSSPIYKFKVFEEIVLSDRGYQPFTHVIGGGVTGSDGIHEGICCYDIKYASYFEDVMDFIYLRNRYLTETSVNYNINECAIDCADTVVMVTPSRTPTVTRTPSITPTVTRTPSITPTPAAIPTILGLLYPACIIEDPRNIAGSGWHIPSNSDFDILESNILNGGSLKETGIYPSGYWNSPNQGATNIVNFNARGSGRRSVLGIFEHLYNNAYFWSSTEYDVDYQYIRSLSYATVFFLSGFRSKWEGLSIRLVKDSTTLTHGQIGTYLGNNGILYRTICIDGPGGPQEWLSSNLAETRFQNGDIIPELRDVESWTGYTECGYCAYDNNWSYVPGVAPTPSISRTPTPTITPTPSPLPPLELVFDDISNLPFTGATNVSEWNTFFDLPTNGTPFSSVSVVSNTVNLYGGSDITLKPTLFAVWDDDVGFWVDNTWLLSVDDQNGSITSSGDGSFYDCVALTSVNLPELLTGGTYCFAYDRGLSNLSVPKMTNALVECFRECISLVSPNFNSLLSIGDSAFMDCTGLTNPSFNLLVDTGPNCFSGCISLFNPSFDSLTVVGGSCFGFCESLVNPDFIQHITHIGEYGFQECNGLINPNFSSLQTIDNYAFWICDNLSNVNFSGVTTVGDIAFGNCLQLTGITLSSCTNLGSSVTNNGVFTNISGNTITLTVPSALMTCNGGNPDGDIQYLQANNTVTIIQV